MTRETRCKVEALFKEASSLEKPCGYLEYERVKCRLRQYDLNDAEYAAAIKQLCSLMEL